MKINPLIVALDVDNLDAARKLVKELGDTVDIYKVGFQLFTAHGPAVVRMVAEAGKKTFLDLKFHDIPNTVASAIKSAAGLGSVFMLTVHTQGGLEMMQAAVKARGGAGPLIVGVTVLTSQAADANMSQVVLERAKLAKQAGLDGVVASVEEAALIRKELGKDFVIVTPGIRPAGADAGDQKRIATPQAAIQSGSSYLVVGRPIVADPAPRLAAQKISQEIQTSL